MNNNDAVVEKLDKVMGKLEGMEQEFTLQMGKYSQIGDLEERIEDLENRVKKIEQTKL